MKLTIEQLNNLIRNQVKAALQEKRKVSLKTIFEDISEQTEEVSGLEEQAPIPPPAAIPVAPASTVPQASGMAASTPATDPFAMPPAPPAPSPAPTAAPAAPVMPAPQAIPTPAPSPAVPAPQTVPTARAPMFETSRWQKLAGILNEKEEKNWMQKAGEEMEKKGTKGALHRQLGKEEDEKISKRELESIKKRLQKKAEGDKKLSAEDRKLLRRVVFALNAMKAD